MLSGILPPCALTTRSMWARVRVMFAVLCIIHLALAACMNDAEAKTRKRHASNKASHHRVLRKKKAATAARPAPDITSALIIDATNGQVLFAEDATEARYPASLTKMMTLYMTFEALSKGKLRLNQQMYVSARAASMPQTNLSLRAGSYLPVETAIRALVVRSANDAAVVVGETLGGTEAGFAEMMTRKARQLGMNSTTFKNASGLPNKEQKTTARDLAMLGLALNRHYPQYYHYFKTTQFDYMGRTYKTHNRVLLKYPGCDGLKTGFINASGFNLVSSVRRNGRHLIGVVMGGSSGASRDNYMMELMDRALGIRGKPFPSAANDNRSSDPRKSTVLKPKNVRTPLDSKPAATTAVPTQPALRPTLNNTTDRADANNRAAPTPTLAPATGTLGTIKTQHAATTTAASIALANQQAKAPPAEALGGWGIQIGSYANAADAQQATAKALARLPAALSSRATPATQRYKGVYRARIAGLSATQSRDACRALVQHNTACFVYSAN